MSKDKNSESEDKKKKTKLEKICELQGNLKVVKEENRRLKKEIHQLKVASRGSHSLEEASLASDFTDGTSPSVGGGNEKLGDALRALKRVTVKQELSLSTLRSKARQRRHEIEQRDLKIKELKEEIKALKQAHENLRGVEKNGDKGKMMSRLADLELELARAGSTTTEQNKILEENKESITTLRDQLEKVKVRQRPPSRQPSSRSLKSNESSLSAAEDINRLKRELAKKLEKIVNLEYDLEAAQDEIHELKQKKNFGESFPATPAPGVMEDFFSDEEEEEEEFWGK